MVDVVAPSEQQPVAVTAEVRWSGGVASSPQLIGSTWARVHAHANEAGDSKGADSSGHVSPNCSSKRRDWCFCVDPGRWGVK